MRERAQKMQLLEKLLKEAGIKLMSVATDISGVSGRPMLEALIAVQPDPAALAELSTRRLRSKITGADRGPYRPVQRTSYVPGPECTGPDRPALRGRGQAHEFQNLVAHGKRDLLTQAT